MYMVASTVRTKGGRFIDQWSVYETMEEAQKVYNEIIQLDKIYAACISKLIEATEPHYLED